MGYNLAGLFGCQAVVHGTVEVESDLDRLPPGNKRCDGYKAAVSGGEVGTLPQVAEQRV